MGDGCRSSRERQSKRGDQCVAALDRAIDRVVHDWLLPVFGEDLMRTISMVKTAGRRGIVGLALSVLMGMAAVVHGQTTLPVLWTAGGSTASSSVGHMAVDSHGNVSVVSGTTTRALDVTSYAADGALRWRRSVTLASGSTQGDWVAAAANDDLVVLGHNVDSRGSAVTATVLRFSSDGTLLWRVDRPERLVSVARLLVDGFGDVYVAFNSQVAKYDANGTPRWTQTMPTGRAASIALGPGGSDIVVTGSVRGRWVTMSMNAATGTQQWSVVASEGTGAVDVTVDTSRVYVTGQGSVGTGLSLAVIAYDRASGTRVWRRDATPPGYNSAGQRIALAPDGSVVATGYASAGGYLDWWTVVVDPSGATRWQARRDRATAIDEYARRVFVLSDGTVVVAGSGGPVQTDALGNSYLRGVIAGYGPTGTLLWEGYTGLGAVWADATPSGNLCAAGGYDAFVTCWGLSSPTPPIAPSGLSATLTNALRLTWQDNATNETNYSVERAVFSPSTGWSAFASLATLPADSTTYDDAAYVAAVPVRYRVRASNSVGESPYSNVVDITIFADGLPPTAALTATPSSGPAPLTVTWDGRGSTDPDNAIVSWFWDFGDGTAGTGALSSHVYTAPGTWTATLMVLDATHLPAWASAPVTVSALAPPVAPTTLTATALSRSSIRLQWVNPNGGLADVWIERCTGSGCTAFAQIAVVGGATTTFTDAGLSARTTYTYRVRAHNAAGASPYSNTAAAKTPR